MSLNLSVDNYCINFLSISNDHANDKQIFGDETFFICVQDDEEEVIYVTVMWTTATSMLNKVVLCLCWIRSEDSETLAGVLQIIELQGGGRLSKAN